MSGIAHLFLRRGFTVSGSDVKSSAATDALYNAGARIFIGHRAEQVRGAGVIVYSSAVREDNPEMAEGRSLGIPVMKRAQALAELMKDKTVITVAGSHGKTTTSSLLSYLLLEAGLCPTIAVGGIVRNIDTNACIGDGEFFVAEADESDGSFLYYTPKYSIITNIDREHLDYYHDFSNEINAFREFIGRTTDSGCLFCCYDDKNLRNLLKNYKRRHVLFGLSNQADIYPENISLEALSSRFDCRYNGVLLGSFRLLLGGLHNISNATGVIAAGLELGIRVEVIQKVLAGFQGAKRRLEVKLSTDKFTVIDDYAHHPTEIRASLAALKQFGSRRVIAIFQPHRYTRTQLLLQEFGRCFEHADKVIITDIYAANEQPIPGVTGESVCNAVREVFQHKEVNFVSKEQIPDFIKTVARDKDVIVTLGAGDITKISDQLAKLLG